MKALVKAFDKPGIWMRDVEKPTIGPDQVLIKVRKTAICGTDIHIYQWNDWAQKTIKVPMTIGHEFVGTIAEVGVNVNHLEVGELVSAEGHVVCNRCRNCLAGNRHLCINTQGIGVQIDGAFAEYVAVPAVNVWKCASNVPEDFFAIFDPFGNAVHTALSFNILGEDVLVTGAGPIGIMAAAVAVHAGARHVVLTDVNDFRLELAQKLCNAQTTRMEIRTVNTMKQPLAPVMKELNMREGFDIGLEMSGNHRAFNDIVDNCRNGGKIALLGLQEPGTVIDWDKVVFRGLTIKGIYGREMFETWYKMTNIVQSGFDLNPIITHRFAVDNFEQGFEVMASGKSGKVILNWE